MIGHFGLGFYSAFMVADEVHIDTLSYTEGAVPVHWSCDGGTEYDIQEGNKTTVGTEITLSLMKTAWNLPTNTVCVKYWRNIVPLCR